MVSTQRRRLLAPLVGAVAALALATGLAVADAGVLPTDTTVGLAGGSTTLVLDSGTAAALGKAGVGVAPIAPAGPANGGIAFPITGGRIDPATAQGVIEHSGGLELTAGSRSLSVSDFTVYTTPDRSPVLVAQVAGGGSLPLLRLDLSAAQLTRPGFATDVTGVQATLTKTAAKALNAYFSTSLFTGGLAIGTVSIDAVPAELYLDGSDTSLTVDAGALAALKSLGIAPAPVGTATLNGPVFDFPITRGLVDATTLAGAISHGGGISLTKGSTTVVLRSFGIRITPAGATLSARIGDERIRILSLDLSKASIVPNAGARTVTVGNVVASLTSDGAAALNGAFHTTAFAQGLVLGVAQVNAHAR